jgi:hypothetical protein
VGGQAGERRKAEVHIQKQGPHTKMWEKCKTNWYKAVSSALNFPLLKEVSQNCFVFDVVNFENLASLADLLFF